MRRTALALCLAVTAGLVIPAFPAHSAPLTVIVHGAGGSVDAALAALTGVGATPGTRFDGAGAVAAVLGPAQLAALGADARVSGVEADRPLRYMTAKPTIATGQDFVYGRPVRDAWGRVVDGTGVGVAVIDTGIDATHPDLASRVVYNKKVVCNGGICGVADVQLPNTDDGGGHGTHVAGIVGGTGAASAGSYGGNARGAAIYGLSAGTGLSILTSSSALQWIIDNHDRVSPPIRVVNNSWGSPPGPHNSNDITSKLTSQLVGAGVVVVWAAGNDGGNGSSDMTSPQSKHAAPGSLSVANFDDRGTGTRDGRLDSSSSRGAASNASTWPDVSAPGANIMSTCRLTLPVCNAHLKPSLQYPNLYAELSGTSMAAPQVAGIVAQLLQANPGLSPADVEWVLERSAYKFSFGAPYSSDGSSLDKGFGLVDVVAALRWICPGCSNL